MNRLAAGGADAFALERRHVCGRATERARGLQLANQDRIPFDADDQMVPLVDVEHPPSLGWDDHPPEVIDLASNTGVHTSSVRRTVPHRSPGGVTHILPDGRFERRQFSYDLWS